MFKMLDTCLDTKVQRSRSREDDVAEVVGVTSTKSFWYFHFQHFISAEEITSSRRSFHADDVLDHSRHWLADCHDAVAGVEKIRSHRMRRTVAAPRGGTTSSGVNELLSSELRRREVDLHRPTDRSSVGRVRSVDENRRWSLFGRRNARRRADVVCSPPSARGRSDAEVDAGDLCNDSSSSSSS